MNNSINSDLKHIALELKEANLIHNNVDVCDVSFLALTGGVSSDIFLVSDGKNKLIIKRALPRLRVKDDWYADISRNRYEHSFLSYVAKLNAEFVTRVLYINDDAGFFAMEYLGEGFTSWKTLLLNKQIDPHNAFVIGTILATIHKASWKDESLLKKFDSTKQFIQLRIEPYLLTTGMRTPHLQDLFMQEAERLIVNRLCLVHGDYSPKNILVGNNRIAIVDCEVAWFGDPSFDVCFLLNHIFLKAIYHHDQAEGYLSLTNDFWKGYAQTLGKELVAYIKPCIKNLLLMLMLARIDGKSPVEYLTDENKRQLIRDFVSDRLKDDTENSLTQLTNSWLAKIQSFIRR